MLGYSNSDKDILYLVDDNYDNSEMIRSMKLNKDGSFYRYAKLISNEEINNLIDKTDKVIDKVIDNIVNAEYDINPKKIGDENIGCKFCKFKDICYMENDDIVLLDKEGEIDA